MTLPKFQQIPYKAPSLVIKLCIIWLHSCFPLFHFVNPIQKEKTNNCFILVFNDSYFSYTVAAEYKPPTSSGAQINYYLYQHYERHWLFWSYGEMVQRTILEEFQCFLLPQDFALFMTYNSNLDIQQTWMCTKSAVVLFPHRLVMSLVLILQNLAQQVLILT